MPLAQIPVFVRAGAVLPTQPAATHTPDRPRDHLVLTTYGDESGSRRLYDDAGTGFAYQHGAYTWTTVSHTVTEAGQTLAIGAAVGSFPGELLRRSWTAVFHDIGRPSEVTVNRAAVPWRYDAVSRTITVRTPELDVSQPVDIVVAR